MMPRHKAPVRASDRLLERLKELHDTSGLSFREIAATDEFGPVPHSALHQVYTTQTVPGRWRKYFKIYMDTPCPGRVAVHKTDMPSAARTLRRHLTPEALAELTDLLLAGHIK